MADSDGINDIDQRVSELDADMRKLEAGGDRSSKEWERLRAEREKLLNARDDEF